MPKKLTFILLIIISSSCGKLPWTLSSSDATEVSYRLQTRFQQNGFGMLPTVAADSILIIDEEAYEQTLPVRGDIILFQFPPDPEILFVKRVIGLPNEQIKMVDGTVLIDDVPLIEAYIEEPATYIGSWETDDDTFFVLGDNRNNSSDSHNWGILGAEFILGKVIAICTSDSPNKCLDVAD